MESSNARGKAESLPTVKDFRQASFEKEHVIALGKHRAGKLIPKADGTWQKRSLEAHCFLKCRRITKDQRTSGGLKIIGVQPRESAARFRSDYVNDIAYLYQI